MDQKRTVKFSDHRLATSGSLNKAAIAISSLFSKDYQGLVKFFSQKARVFNVEASYPDIGPDDNLKKNQIGSNYNRLKELFNKFSMAALQGVKDGVNQDQALNKGKIGINDTLNSVLAKCNIAEAMAVGANSSPYNESIKNTGHEQPFSSIISPQKDNLAHNISWLAIHYNKKLSDIQINHRNNSNLSEAINAIKTELRLILAFSESNYKIIDYSSLMNINNDIAQCGRIVSLAENLTGSGGSDFSSLVSTINNVKKSISKSYVGNVVLRAPSPHDEGHPERPNLPTNSGGHEWETKSSLLERMSVLVENFDHRLDDISYSNSSNADIQIEAAHTRGNIKDVYKIVEHLYENYTLESLRAFSHELFLSLIDLSIASNDNKNIMDAMKKVNHATDKAYLRNLVLQNGATNAESAPSIRSEANAVAKSAGVSFGARRELISAIKEKLGPNGGFVDNLLKIKESYPENIEIIKGINSIIATVNWVSAVATRNDKNLSKFVLRGILDDLSKISNALSPPKIDAMSKSSQEKLVDTIKSCNNLILKSYEHNLRTSSALNDGVFRDLIGSLIDVSNINKKFSTLSGSLANIKEFSRNFTVAAIDAVRHGLSSSMRNSLDVVNAFGNTSILFSTGIARAGTKFLDDRRTKLAIYGLACCEMGMVLGWYVAPRGLDVLRHMVEAHSPANMAENTAKILPDVARAIGESHGPVIVSVAGDSHHKSSAAAFSDSNTSKMSPHGSSSEMMSTPLGDAARHSPQGGQTNLNDIRDDLAKIYEDKLHHAVTHIGRRHNHNKAPNIDSDARPSQDDNTRRHMA